MQDGVRSWDLGEDPGEELGSECRMGSGTNDWVRIWVRDQNVGEELGCGHRMGSGTGGSGRGSG